MADDYELYLGLAMTKAVVKRGELTYHYEECVFWDVTPSSSCKTDVSKERSASIIMVTRICELGTALAVPSCSVFRLLVTVNVVPTY
jgi:hypothetical protein